SFPYLALPHAGDSDCGGTVADLAAKPDGFLGGFSGFNKNLVNNGNSAARATGYPNPFASNTTIRYEVEASTEVNISVFDRMGKLVQTLVNQPMDPGIYEAPFEGISLPSGLYFVRITTNGGKDQQVLKLAKQ
ncbi:MAG: T9SS type A sorting domain-containing protein, partial [Saprospiraceae bacterium]